MTATLDGFTLGRTLGSGFSAKVKLGTSQEGQEYALKIFRLDNPQFNAKAFKLLKEEVDATTSLDFQHVVKYFEFKENATMIKKNGQQIQVAYIVQEMISGGELFDYVANTGPFSEAIAKYYFKQVLKGVHYIHSKGFSHRDLKPENILLDKNYDVKIVDFGFACALEGRDGSGTNQSQIGTPGYMAPEILSRQPYQGQVVDLFALAVILFILYSGHPPFAVANEDDGYFKLLVQNRSDMFWKAHSSKKAAGFYSEEFKDLMTCMLQNNAHQRLCIVDIIGHPWISNGGEASPDDVRQEFATREQTNKQRALEDREQKAAQRAQNGGIRRDLNIGDKVYRCFDDIETEDANETKQVIRLNCKEYNENQNRTHAFFSHYRPDYLLAELTQEMTTKGQEFTMSATTWKLNFNVKKTINEEEIKNAEGQAPAPIYELAKLQVEILKVPGQEKYCVEFQRKAGSAILFYDNANQYIDALEMCNNTTLDEDDQ